MGSPEQDVLDRLIVAEQDERRRLALFLHDGPVQQLSGIALMLDGALHALAGGDEQVAREIIEQALTQHRATIRELRDLSFALEPVVLRDQGIETALRALADQTRSSHGVNVSLELDGAGTLGPTASIAVYTILRELVEQSLRRGPPRTITVTLERDAEGTLLAAVADDAEPERRRRSIEAIAERARALHGTLEVTAGDGRGEVRVLLPAHTANR